MMNGELITNSTHGFGFTFQPNFTAICDNAVNGTLATCDDLFQNHKLLFNVPTITLIVGMVLIVLEKTIYGFVECYKNRKPRFQMIAPVEDGFFVRKNWKNEVDQHYTPCVIAIVFAVIGIGILHSYQSASGHMCPWVEKIFHEKCVTVIEAIWNEIFSS